MNLADPCSFTAAVEDFIKKAPAYTPVCDDLLENYFAFFDPEADE